MNCNGNQELNGKDKIHKIFYTLASYKKFIYENPKYKNMEVKYFKGLGSFEDDQLLNHEIHEDKQKK